MNNGLAKIIIAVIIGFVIIKACSGRRSDSEYRQSSQLENWQKSPLDDIIKSLSDKQDFSIILYDMDADDSQYKHKYRIVSNEGDSVTAKETEWYPVSDVFFEQHLNDMGMEIASKKDGVVHKEAAPAGYTNYVGNPQYGHWVERNGSSFWEFYGKYAFLSSMFNLMTYPARRAYWDDYYGGYYGRGRSYYGPSGRTIYGTRSYTSSNTGKTTTWGSKPSTFKSKVRSQVSRSASATKSRSYSSGSSYSKTSRSSSRSSSGSSFRSRSGGFGK
ncbi:hypothetical protein [Fulvivirga ligni]|uniref:hypothetical protein n=1 Tax=Fulvivirga ligni TaxID=2904246 RepID=UPI001F18B952|nr:hypothetical protein [Fulvivirga ligni]UII20946.1 hypothetical protein LVD16_24180 [Fulvivirga ligni]